MCGARMPWTGAGGERLLAGLVATVVGDGEHTEAVVSALAGAGASVVVAGRERNRLAALAERVGADGGDVLAVPVDVTDPGSVQRLVDQTLGAYGRLDAAVNAVPFPGAGPTRLTALPVAEYDDALRGMLRGVFCAMKYQIPAMAARGGGAVVNLTHSDGRRPVAGYAARAAAASGVVGLTRAAALEYGDAGVRANVLLAGGSAADTAPMASTAVWLCSPLSVYVTGAVFPTDEREDMYRCVSA